METPETSLDPPLDKAKDPSGSGDVSSQSSLRASSSRTPSPKRIKSSTSYSSTSRLTIADHHKVTNLLRDLDNDELIGVGVALGLYHRKLKRMKDLLGDIVTAWLKEDDNVTETSGSPSWASLAKALEDMDHKGIASKIRKATSSPHSLPSQPSEAQVDIVEWNLDRSHSFGGTGGLPFDDNVLSHSPPVVGIKEMWIHHGNQVDSIQAKYQLANGSTYITDKHGGSGGNESHIIFQDGEKIIKIEGKTNGVLVDQLTFITKTSSGTQKTFGPYGKTGRTPFTLQGEIIAGFFGRSGTLLDSIGFYYVQPEIKLEKSQRWGGNGGSSFDDGVLSHSPPVVGIKEIWIRHGNQVDSIQAKYQLANGSTYIADKHGGSGGNQSHIIFEDGEKIIQVHGKTSGVLVDQLTFITKTSCGTEKTYGPYGKTGYTPFTLQGEIITGFFGQSGNLLDSVGFYYA